MVTELLLPNKGKSKTSLCSAGPATERVTERGLSGMLRTWVPCIAYTPPPKFPRNFTAFYSKVLKYLKEHIYTSSLQHKVHCIYTY